MSEIEFKPTQFIGETIEVAHDRPPFLVKKPGCPDRFTWRECLFEVVEILNEWHDYRRRGRMSRTMKPQHSSRASHTGSWGVGQDYYRVRTQSGRIFDLYYDRAPKDANRRTGEWVLYQELEMMM